MGDCDDANSTIYPGAVEICSDGIDQDCNGSDLLCGTYLISVVDPSTITLASGGEAIISLELNQPAGPGGVTIPISVTIPSLITMPSTITILAGSKTGNVIVSSVDGVGVCTIDFTLGTQVKSVQVTIVLNDVDGDGFKAPEDCNDNDPTIYPGATEICGDGIDQDCSGQDLSCSTDPDVDNDGDRYTENQGDCNDTDARIYPGAIELCDGKDNNCNGVIDEFCVNTCTTNGDCPSNFCVRGICASVADPDNDRDGFTVGMGDCDDANSTIYPGAVEVCGDGIDQDCNGTDLECIFDLDSHDPVEAAKSIGINQGLLSANWALPDGSTGFNSPEYTIGYGILSTFGPNVTPLQGDQMLAISTGTARTPTDPGYLSDYKKGYTNNFPTGFPFGNSVCPTPSSAHDGVALKVTLHVPENITHFRFNYKFYSKEYPRYICSAYNDQAVVIVTPYPEGSINGNIIFDSSGNPPSVNSGSTFICCAPSGQYLCPSGTSQLLGTGFDSNGGTEWLSITVPVQSNTTIEVVFAIWDAGDDALTSSLLIDNWQWLTK
jgi:hypothetical protein